MIDTSNLPNLPAYILSRIDDHVNPLTPEEISGYISTHPTLPNAKIDLAALLRGTTSDITRQRIEAFIESAKQINPDILNFVSFNDPLYSLISNSGAYIPSKPSFWEPLFLYSDEDIVVTCGKNFSDLLNRYYRPFRNFLTQLTGTFFPICLDDYTSVFYIEGKNLKPVVTFNKGFVENPDFVLMARMATEALLAIKNPSLIQGKWDAGNFFREFSVAENLG